MRQIHSCLCYRLRHPGLSDLVHTMPHTKRTDVRLEEMNMMHLLQEQALIHSIDLLNLLDSGRTYLTVEIQIQHQSRRLLTGGHILDTGLTHATTTEILEDQASLILFLQ